MVSEDTSPELSNQEYSVRGKVRPGSLLLNLLVTPDLNKNRSLMV